MANIISLHACGRHLSMSNGLTSVFFSTLGLSGTRLAKSDEEKGLVTWLLERDQSAVGEGTVGFDVCEMPWNAANFDEMKRFLLSVIEGAKQRIGWEFLEYHPNEGLLFPRLQQFQELISDVEVGMLDSSATAQNRLKDTVEVRNDPAEAPNDPMACGFPRCKKHPVFLTAFGCYLCNH